jgi:transitional endoplasmic reticulum ATPase
MGTGHGAVATVQGARKRDAGRGKARLSEAVRSELGLLSGDPVIIEGTEPTVAKVWPSDENGRVVRIDDDTRRNAGVTVGDEVTLRSTSVAEAERVELDPLDAAGAEMAGRNRTVANRLRDRLLDANERVHVEGAGTFRVTAVEPAGPVRVVAATDVAVAPATESEPAEDADAESDAEGAAARVTYEDIGGLDDELDLVREMVELPISAPGRFERLGIEPPRGVLLHGPPGTGKTLIAKAVAAEVDAHFEAISGPEIVSKYKGQSEKRLREAFERAAENAPAILFIDEIDSIAGSRDEEADMENRVVAQLLTLLDGLESRGDVVVVGATNRVDTVDEALRRGGRFDREIEIGVPDEAGRREILEVHTRDVPLGADVDLDGLAARTHGFVGADLDTLVTEAAMHALRRDEGDDTVEWGDLTAALTAVDPSAMREYVAEAPTVTFADVGGLDEAKERLEAAVSWPLEYAPLFDATATEPPTGVLLHGPPGTGKTLLARAVAGESGVNFIHVEGPELLDRYVGESEEAVREVFQRARQTAPSIIFFDEVDAIAGRRGGESEVVERVVSQLLAELDGNSANPDVVALAATNRRDDLDPALLRPGRLEEHVHVPHPDAAARREILAVHAEGKPLAGDVDLDALASQTAGASGAELAAVLRRASLRAIRSVATDVDPDAAASVAEDVTIETADVGAARAAVLDED